MEPLYASIRDAAHALAIGRSKTYQLINSGQLETVKLGTRTLVRVASIKAFSDSLTKRAA